MKIEALRCPKIRKAVMLKNIIAIFICLISVSCVSLALERTQFGVHDENASNRIDRANTIIFHYKNKEYRAIEKILLDDLNTYQADAYAKQHILNELAELYSHYILDLEKAVEADKQILELGNVSDNGNNYILRHITANNKVLGDELYKTKYHDINSSGILVKAKTRLNRNEQLIKAEPVSLSKVYDKKTIEQYLNNIKSDIQKTYKNTPDRYELVSRLIRAEYELYRITGDKKVVSEGYRYFLTGEMKPENIYFSEIDFISFADYLQIAFENSKKMTFAEYSLSTVYKPYFNMKWDKWDKWGQMGTNGGQMVSGLEN